MRSERTPPGGRPAARITAFLVLLAVPTIEAQVTITSLATSEANVALPQVRSPISGTDGSTYSITYDGIELRIDEFEAGGNVYHPTASGQALVRRSSAAEEPWPDATTPTANPNQVTAWNAVAKTGTGTPTPHTVHGRYLETMDELFTSQNLWTGTENLFVNTAPAGSGNVVNNIERMDYIFSGTFMAGDDSGFVVFERGAPGNSGSNGGFKMAAITGIVNGLPTFAGSNVVTVAPDSYGKGTLIPWTRYDVFHREVSSDTELNEIFNVAIGPQGISGVFLRASDFVDAGTEIYGYSVFALDVTGSDSQLDNWNNSTFFPRYSDMSNDLDLIASGAFGFTLGSGQGVPEPSSSILLAVASLTMASRRRRA